MDAKITIGQIGCGYWGPNLLRNFSSLPQCHVKYVAEQSRERRDYVESNFPKTQAVEDVQQIYNDPAVQAILVATPARSHFELAKAALTQGKHVFVEKPLAMSVAEVDALGALAEKGGLTLMVGHTFLYHPAVNFLKKLVADGELGQIYYAYTQRLNLGIIRSDVNAMWNLAPHDVSILCYLLGSTVTSVAACGTAYIQDGVEDVVFMNLEFENKVRGNIQVSWLDPNKIRRITLVGSKKMVVYDDVADDKIIIYDKGIDRENPLPAMPFDRVSPGKLVHRAGDIHLPKISMKEPLRVEAEHFVQCIRKTEVPRTGYQHARQVIEVLEKAQSSLGKKDSVSR